MPWSKQMLGVKGDECQCGRRETIRHCPSCGSTRIYARKDRFHEFADGTIRKVTSEYRCQACGHIFVDEERAFCEAPPVGQKLAAQKARAIYEAKQQGEYLSPQEAKLANAIDTLVDGKLSKEQREEAENKIDLMLRQVWTELVFAHRDGKGIHPGPIDAFLAEKKKEFRVSAEGSIEQVQPQTEQPT